MQSDFVRPSEEGSVRDIYREYYVFATWTRDGGSRIGIRFNYFQNYEPSFVFRTNTIDQLVE